MNQKKFRKFIRWQKFLKIDYDEDGIKIHYKTSKQNSDKIKKIIYN